MKKLQVCFSPELLHLYTLNDKVVVVTDILRATSCITTAFAHGAKAVIPVSELDECKALQQSGYICAAERNGKKVEGFELDNSPYSYMCPSLKNKSISITTTNGTRAIEKSKNAREILIGCYLNKKALAEYLKTIEHDLLIICAGWKGCFNLEDTLFAGALTQELDGFFYPDDDAGQAAIMLYKSASHDLVKTLENSSHYKRLKHLNIDRDIEFCLNNHDIYSNIPVMVNNSLINRKHIRI